MRPCILGRLHARVFHGRHTASRLCGEDERDHMRICIVLHRLLHAGETGRLTLQIPVVPGSFGGKRDRVEYFGQRVQLLFHIYSTHIQSYDRRATHW